MKSPKTPMKVAKDHPMNSIPMKATVEKVPTRAETHEMVLTKTETLSERMKGVKSDRIK